MRRHPGQATLAEPVPIIGTTIIGRTVARLAAAIVAVTCTSVAAAQPPSTPPTGSRDLIAMTFAGTPIGGFPARLERVDGVMEVVMKDGQPMLRATARSTFRVSLPEALPQDFMLEFDLVPKMCCQPEDISFEGTAVINQGSASANVLWHHTHQMVVGGGPTHSSKVPEDIAVAVPGALTKIVFSMQGDNMTMFTNGQALYTIQRKFARSRVLRVFLGGQNDGERAVYLARLRIAAIGPSDAVGAATGVPRTGTILTPESVSAPSPPAVPSSRVITLSAITATGVWIVPASRTIDLAEVIAIGPIIVVTAPTRATTLPGTSGGSTVPASRTIALPVITAVGTVSVPLSRTIVLPMLTATGSVKIP